MKIYLDTSVIAILLLGEFSESNKFQYSIVQKFAGLINQTQIKAIVSIYSLQEIFSLCQKIAAPEEYEIFAWQTFRKLFNFNFGLVGLLSREKRLLYRRYFSIADQSDEPHVITAYINNCDAIITYDSHFAAITDKISVYTPEEFLSKY